MNPTASSYVPRAPKVLAPAVVAPKATTSEPVPNVAQVAPQPSPVKKETTQPEQPKKVEKVPEKTETQPKVFQPSEEDLKKELKKMAEEEGVTEEELLADDGKEEKKTEEEDDPREHINLCFIGHVDAGKSTISGQILLLSGKVDQRTIEKYEREAKENNRESWVFAYIMDTNDEERAKGKTVEVGKASFETEKKRYTILDAPGHKNYVPNMIGGASQADIGILVISAKKGEFESGFHKSGQTREHAMLAKTLGIKYLLVVINKMDDSTVNWEKQRYDEISGELGTFLKSVGFNVKTDVIFLPISGLKGTNIKENLSKEVCPWYDGVSLLNTLDNLKPMERLSNSPLRMPVMDRYKDRGSLTVLGKIESGSVSKGDVITIMPNKISAEVLGVIVGENKMVKTAKPGENAKLMLKNIEEEQVQRGFVICSPKALVPCQNKFEAIVSVLELLPHKSVFTAGYSAVIHVHTAVEECTVLGLLEQLDKKTGNSVKLKPQFVTAGQLVRLVLECKDNVCIELFSEIPQLGRFTLRDEGKTIAIGKITALAPKKKTAPKN